MSVPQIQYLVVFCFLYLDSQPLISQTGREFEIHTIAFYNLENLFDTINDPLKNDEASPIMDIQFQRGLVYQQKVHNMAKAIAQIGKTETGKPPVVLGLAELENRSVIEDLLNDPELQPYNYGMVHYDSPDRRGIDVALIYQKALFVPTSASRHELTLYDRETGYRIYTRDQLVVSGLFDNEPIHFIVNHWPSRSGGEMKTRPRRIAAAKNARKLVDSLQAIDPYSKIIVMGDLNDNPNDRSVKVALRTQSDKSKLRLKDLYNPMELIFNQGMGSNAFRDQWSLFDQIILSEPFLKQDYSSYRYYRSGIFNERFLVTPNGPYKGYPFRSFNASGFTGGFSDHFPAYIYVIRERL